MPKPPTTKNNEPPRTLREALTNGTKPVLTKDDKRDGCGLVTHSELVKVMEQMHGDLLRLASQVQALTWRLLSYGVDPTKAAPTDDIPF
jgi:hypothetical protein